MKFKLDENFGRSVQEVFIARGHDCLSVVDEGLGGAPDPKVLEAAVSEGRILVTMDQDFGNVLAYPPGPTEGIAVATVPGRGSLELLRSMALAFLSALELKPIRGRLWVIEPARIREHEAPES